jgi:hypothetical protein
VLEVVFVSPDGERTPGPIVELPAVVANRSGAGHRQVTRAGADRPVRLKGKQK